MDVPSFEEWKAHPLVEAVGSNSGDVYKIIKQHNILGPLPSTCISPQYSFSADADDFWYVRSVSLQLLIETDETEFLRVVNSNAVTQSLFEKRTRGLAC